MSTLAPSDAADAVYIRRQKAFAAPVVVPNEDCRATTFGAGVGMHSPTMQKHNRSFVPRSSNADSGLVTSQFSAGGSLTKRVSFNVQKEARSQNARERIQATSTTADSFASHESGPREHSKHAPHTVEMDALPDQSAFLNLFASAPQRDVDTCIHFAALGGPLVKHSSRAHRPPVLCTFRLADDGQRLVWAESSKPHDEKYGLDTSTLAQVLVGTAAAAAFESSGTGSNVKSAGLRLVLMLQGDEKLRLEALDKVSLRYWAFALHFIFVTRNRGRLLPTAPHLAPAAVSANVASAPGTSRAAAAPRETNSSAAAGQSDPKATQAKDTESQLSVVRAFFSKARHGRLDALVQMLDDNTVSVDALDEHGNTVLIVAAQNNNKRICKAALRRGANIHHQNNTGQTCLHFTFALGYDALGEYLLSKGGSETLRNNYGLTCRQGLAPCSSLQQAPEDAAKSPIHGFITQRGDRAANHRPEQRCTPSKLSLPSDDSSAHGRVQQLQSGLSAGGFATDRPSPSAQRLRYGASSSSTSNATSGLLASKSPVGKLNLEARAEAKSEVIPLSSSNGTAAAPLDIQEQLDFASENVVDASKSGYDPSGINQVSENRAPALERRPVSALAPPDSRKSRLENGGVPERASSIQSVAAAATPDKLHAALSRADAALAASDALSKEFLAVRSPSNFGTIHSASNSANDIKTSASPGKSLYHSQKSRSLAAVSSDDSDGSSSSSSQGGAEDVLRQLHANLGIQPAAASPARSEIKDHSSAAFSIAIPTSAQTAPILLVRRGSSNSSSGSSNGRKLDANGDLANSERHSLQPEFYVDGGGSVAALQRQKLRSGAGALRPTSAGGARKSVRPDLASGLGFKTVDVTSRKSSDGVRMPPRPSTPVLARHASTEEEISLQGGTLPLSPSLASNALKMRLQAAGSESPLSTARVAWGSPAKQK